ncbi:MAG: HD domain-containing protein [Patescibacteria group bacterium]
MLKKIKIHVKSMAEEDDWKYHILPVVNYSKRLSVIYKADKKVVGLAALLHDIGRIRFGEKNHEITGAKEAEKILKKYGYSRNTIDKIKHCIVSHRGSSKTKPKTIAAKIIANADAMAHFDSLPIFFYWRLGGRKFEEVFKWIDEKYKKDWNKKLTLPGSKKILKEKYKAIQIVLNSNKKYI